VRYNNDKKRADKNKILLHGAPNEICDLPEKFDVLDFGVRNRLLSSLQITLLIDNRSKSIQML
jgi:hypothetical protein